MFITFTNHIRTKTTLVSGKSSYNKMVIIKHPTGVGDLEDRGDQEKLCLIDANKSI